jgi:hypothetical protein
MPLISQCIEPGCSKLCMGLFCIEHDSQPSVEFVRGRPWPPKIRLAQPSATRPRFASAAPPVRARVKPAA